LFIAKFHLQLYLCLIRVFSSVGSERYVDNVEVIGSSPIRPTSFFCLEIFAFRVISFFLFQGMLRYYFFCICCLLVSNGFAQDTFDLFAPAVRTPLYRGIDNPVKILYKGKVLKKNEYGAELLGGDGTCFKTDTALIINPGTSYILNLRITDKRGNELHSSKRRILATDPPITIILDGKFRGGLIQREFLHSSMGVIALLDDFPYNYRLYVDSYYAIVYIGNEKRVISCQGPLLSAELKAVLSRLTGGDRVEFSYFNLSGKGGIIRNYDHINFEIQYERFPWDEYRQIVSDIDRQMMYYLNMDSLNEVYRVPVRLSDLDLPVVRETNCNSLTDTCTTSISNIRDGVKSLNLQYTYINGNASEIKWCHGDTLLADFHYNDNGYNYVLYYRNGKKRQEGKYLYQNESIRRQDTIIYLDPLTLDNNNRAIKIEHYEHFKEGPWNYYNEQGDLVKTIQYKDDKEIKN
jgi:hypothetical protein